jgi:hypothetical protein
MPIRKKEYIAFQHAQPTHHAAGPGTDLLLHKMALGDTDQFVVLRDAWT